MSILIGLLSILLYAVIFILVVEIILWLAGMVCEIFGKTIPPIIRKLLYAICGIICLIQLIGLLAGFVFLPPLIHTVH